MTTLSASVARNGIGATASDANPASIATPTTGTTTTFASGAYGAMTKNVAAVIGHVPSCAAHETPAISHMSRGTPRRSSACAIGFAKPKIAATHEKESANEADVTDAGRATRTTIAAIASAFHENASRPARAREQGE